MKTFSNKSNAQRAARKELGGDAFPGVDFHIVPVGNKFGWKPGKPDGEAKPAPAPSATTKATAKPKAKTRPAAGPASSNPPRKTKTDRALDLMRRESGVTGAELQAAFDWASHTVRGFISGHVRKKLGLEVDTDREGATTRYRILSAEEAAGEG